MSQGEEQEKIAKTTLVFYANSPSSCRPRSQSIPVSPSQTPPSPYDARLAALSTRRLSAVVGARLNLERLAAGGSVLCGVGFERFAGDDAVDIW